MVTSITNNDTGDVFTFRGVGGWKVDKSQGVIAVPFIDTTPTNTFLFRFMGQLEEVSFGFAVYDDGTDASDGDTIITVSQQVVYLRDTIFSDEFDTDWTLKDTRYYGGAGVIGVLKKIDIDEQSGSPELARGRVVFLRGRIGAI